MAESTDGKVRKTRKTYRPVFKLIVFVLVLLLFVIVARTLTVGSHMHEAEPCKPLEADFIEKDPQLVTRFQEAIRFQTISRNPHDYNPEELLKFRAFIKKSFPTLHSSSKVQHEIVGNYSLLYIIKGSDSNLKPAMLCAHLDVVPITNEELWEMPPFSGDIKDGYIYGRGTIDTKHSLMAILEAMENHLKNGFTPQRTFVLAFGHDEEVMGIEGASAIFETLHSRGIRPEFILDEGLTVTQNIVAGVKSPVAIIGITEKGYLTVHLKVNYTGGHSSVPNKESSIGILSKAVARLEAAQHPSMFGYGPEKEMFEELTPKMSLPWRVVMSNLWLFGPAVSWVMSLQPTANALVRTTTAITEFHAGIKSNVLPPWAWATVNHRIHPSQTIEQVIEYDKYIINDDRVKLDIVYSDKPSPVSTSSDNNFGYQTIKTSINQVFDEAIVVPGTLVGNTDTRHYHKLSKNIYRFCPTVMFPEDIKRFHGVNERISVKNYKQTVHFYYHMIANANRMKLPPMHEHVSEL